MELRDAGPEDTDDVRRVVRRSFEASYALDPQAIRALLEEPFGADRLASRVTDEGTTVLVAERDGEIVGVAEGSAGDVESEGHAELRWLHVHPEHRGDGVGTGLLERLRDVLSDGPSDEIRAHVLDANAEGSTFLERDRFERIDRAERDVAGETFVEHVYAGGETAGEVDETDGVDVTGGVDDGTDATGDGTGDRPPETVTVDGRELAVDADDRTAGTDAAFLGVLVESGDRFGFYCVNCGTVVETMDELGRIVCETCGNTHRPDQWDDAYL